MGIYIFVPEAWTAVNRDVLVSLLETVVFANIVQIVTSDDDRAHHLVLNDDAGKNTASDRDVAGEWTLLVDVCALNCLKIKYHTVRSLV